MLDKTLIAPLTVSVTSPITYAIPRSPIHFGPNIVSKSSLFPADTIHIREKRHEKQMLALNQDFVGAFGPNASKNLLGRQN